MIAIFLKNLLVVIGTLILLAILFIALIIFMWVFSAVVIALIEYINEKGE